MSRERCPECDCEDFSEDAEGRIACEGCGTEQTASADQRRTTFCDCCGDDCTPTPFGREAALMVCVQCRKDAASVANTGDVCSQCAARCDADGLLDYCGHRLCKACAASEANALHRCPTCGTGWASEAEAARCATEYDA